MFAACLTYIHWYNEKRIKISLGSVPSNTERASDLWHNQSKNSATPPLPDRPVRGDTTLQNYVRELVRKDAA